jgi:outer membrane protein TolC
MRHSVLPHVFAAALLLLLVPANVTARQNATVPVHSLEQLMRLALQHNRSVQSREGDVRKARLSVRSAEADFDTTVSPAGEVSLSGGSDSETADTYGAGVTVAKKFTRGTQLSATPELARQDGSYQSTLTLSLDQPLLRGIDEEYVLSGVDSARYSLRSALRGLHQTRVNTLLQCVQSTYSILQLQRTVAIYEQSVARLQQAVQSARIKNRVGLATSVEVYRAELNLKQAQDELVQTRQSLDAGREDLRVLLDTDLGTSFLVQAPLEMVPVTVTEPDAVALATVHRVEMESAQDRLREAQRQSRLAKHELLPELNLSLDYWRSGNNEHLAQTASLDDDGWSLGFSTSTDLFQRTEQYAYEQRQVEVEDAKRNQGLVRDQVVADVKDALRSLRGSWEQVRLQESRVNDARGQLQLSRVMFDNGFLGNFELIEAENSLLSAQTQLLAAQVDYVVGLYRLRAAMGTLLEKPEVTHGS